MRVFAMAWVAVLAVGMACAEVPPRVGVEEGAINEGLNETKKPKLTGGSLSRGAVVFVGRITSVDVTGQVVVVSGNEANPRDVSKSLGAPEDRSFKVGAACRIKTEEKARAGIKDLQSGFEVMIRFDRDVRGNYKAETMEPLGAVEDRQEASKKKKSGKADEQKKDEKKKKKKNE